MNYYQKKCEGIMHTIRRGDTLYRLSRMYGVSVSDIMDANPDVNVYNLQIGSMICVPMSMNMPPSWQPGQTVPQCPLQPSVVPDNSMETQMPMNPENNAESQSRDAEGDVWNLESLAMEEDSPVQSQRPVQPPRPPRPPMPPQGPDRNRLMPYRVRRGDSLNSILRMFNMDFDTFARFNPHIMPIPLKTGETVFVTGRRF